MRRRLNDELGADRAYEDLSAELLARAEVRGVAATSPRSSRSWANWPAATARSAYAEPEAVEALADELAARLAVTRAFRASSRSLRP